MKNIKDITLSIFAIIGFLVILSSFVDYNQDLVSPGDYAISTTSIIEPDGTYKKGKKVIYETILNTKTGRIKSRTAVDIRDYKQNSVYLD